MKRLLCFFLGHRLSELWAYRHVPRRIAQYPRKRPPVSFWLWGHECERCSKRFAR